MQTGLIQTHFRANIPPRGRGTDRGGSDLWARSKVAPKRVRRPHGGTGYGTERRRGSCSQKRSFLPKYTIVARASAVL